MESYLVNAYGAALTPLAEELGRVLCAWDRDFHAWAETLDDPRDWAYLSCCVEDGFRDVPLHNSYALGGQAATAWSHGGHLRRALLAWLNGQTLSGSDVRLAHGIASKHLGAVCAELQIEKAMRLRRAARLARQEQT